MASMEAIFEGVELMASELKNAPDFDEKRYARWCTLFDGWTDEDFKAACLKAVQTLTFFPTVGELIKLVNGKDEERETVAWETVRQAIRNHGCHASFRVEDFGGDGAALWAIARMGTEAVGLATDENRAIRRAEFRKLYWAAVEHGYTVTYLSGKWENDNVMRGLDIAKRPALAGRPDWPAQKAIEAPEEVAAV